MDFYDSAYYVVRDMKEKEFRCLGPEVSDEAFMKRSTERWAVDDLGEYMKTNWGSADVVCLISNYIDRCGYRMSRYFGTDIGEQYKIAKDVAKEALLWFI
jgi:hypothetical protein